MNIIGKLKYRFIDILNMIKRLGNSILNSNTVFRWGFILGIMILITNFFGFDYEEIRVTFLLLWYAFISVTLSSIINYIYSTVNYHKPSDDMEKIGSLVIFISTMIFCGLIICGTYIAQYD